MHARQYGNAFRPAKPRGRPRKPPSTPRTHHWAATDAEALRAWKLQQDGADRATIAQALFPNSPMRTEQERRRLLVKVDRRIARGKRLASPPLTR